MRLKPNTVSEFNRTVEKEILPLLQKQKGFRDGLTLVSSNGSEVVGISLWDQRQDAGATTAQPIQMFSNAASTATSPGQGAVGRGRPEEDGRKPKVNLSSAFNRDRHDLAIPQRGRKAPGHPASQRGPLPPSSETRCRSPAVSPRRPACHEQDGTLACPSRGPSSLRDRGRLKAASANQSAQYPNCFAAGRTRCICRQR
jgi:hypothetical protein